MAEEACSLPLHLSQKQLELVRTILGQVIPERHVWAFGSRATGHFVKRFSDLDLAVEGVLSWRQRADLSERFDESLLPIKVDLVEIDLLTPEFRERIERNFVPVQCPAGASDSLFVASGAPLHRSLIWAKVRG